MFAKMTGAGWGYPAPFLLTSTGWRKSGLTSLSSFQDDDIVITHKGCAVIQLTSECQRQYIAVVDLTERRDNCRCVELYEQIALLMLPLQYRNPFQLDRLRVNGVAVLIDGNRNQPGWFTFSTFGSLQGLMSMVSSRVSSANAIGSPSPNSVIRIVSAKLLTNTFRFISLPPFLSQLLSDHITCFHMLGNSS